MSETEGTVENTGGTENAEDTGEANKGGTTMLGADPAKNEANSEQAGTEEGVKPTEEEGKKPTEVKDGEADKTKEDGAPDEYEDFKLPEGYEADKETIDGFKPLAKDLNLTQDQAQKLVDFYNDGAKKGNEATTEYYNNLMSEWQETVRSDKEIGGNNFDDSLGAARSALDAFATPELMEILETSGMGNHPEIVRVFSRIGKAVKEDKIRIGGVSPSAPKDPAEVLFPNQNK